jgi:DNA-binding transcriptional regulator YiaG
MHIASGVSIPAHMHYGLTSSFFRAYFAPMAELTATKIRRMRLALGENQTEFGRRFGVNQSTVARWEISGIPQGTARAALDANWPNLEREASAIERSARKEKRAS